MLPDPPQLVREITALHAETVACWHNSAIDNRGGGLLATVCQQHRFNFLLWHEEDIARSPDAGDQQIAAVKRSIDRYNQQRNDWIEKIDEALVEQLAAEPVIPGADARRNTETPGSAIDRLSIMALRMYHLDEQLCRDDVDDLHVANVGDRLARCRRQHADLSQSLTELLEDIFAGRKVLQVYRQLKMYNDPTLNPYLYRPERLAG